MPKKGWMAVVDAVGGIPIVGPLLKFLLQLLDRKTGFSLLIGLVIGVGSASALVYFGFLPYFKADESVWRWGARCLAIHTKPAALGFKVVLHPTDWRRPFERELEEEGQSVRRSDVSGHYQYGTSALEATVPATSAFVLVLKPSPSFALSGYAFRETSVLPEKQFVEPLNRLESRQDGLLVLRI